MKEEDPKLVSLIRGVVLNEEVDPDGDYPLSDEHEDKLMTHIYKHYLAKEAAEHLEDAGKSPADGHSNLVNMVKTLADDHLQRAKEYYTSHGGKDEHWDSHLKGHMAAQDEAMSDYYQDRASKSNW